METKKQEEVLLLKEQQEEVQLSKEQLKSILGGMSCEISTYSADAGCSSCGTACQPGNMNPIHVCIVALMSKLGA